LAAYKKAPSGDTVTLVGVVPAGTGGPTGVRAPVPATIANAETLFVL